MATVTLNPTWAPKVTMTIDDSTGDFEAVVEVDDLEPTRDTTIEERAAGVTSLDPPTVLVRARATDYETHRAVVDGCLLAVAAAADATDGSTGGIGQLFMLQLRTAIVLRLALRQLERDI